MSRSVESARHPLEGIPYNYHRGPEYKEDDIETIFADGGNCQLVTHLDLDPRFGIELPQYLKSKEMYDPNEWFESIKFGRDEQGLWIPETTLVPGDVFLLGRKGLKDPKKLHLTVVIDPNEELGQTTMLHASQLDGESILWTFDQFGQTRRYETLYGIRRYKHQ